ncbi:hypothetical protein PF010_g33312, partial [Phytophthora fragariae]
MLHHTKHCLANLLFCCHFMVGTLRVGTSRLATSGLLRPELRGSGGASSESSSKRTRPSTSPSDSPPLRPMYARPWRPGLKRLGGMLSALKSLVRCGGVSYPPSRPRSSS